MNVLHLSTWDIQGGAARAAYRLHDGLRDTEVTSRMYVKTKSSQDADVEAYSYRRPLHRRVADRFRRRTLHRRRMAYDDSRPEGLELFSIAQTFSGPYVPRVLPDADVYNLHWINRFIDPLPFFSSIRKPVVWTLHDMNPFTGGCHYNAGCRSFEASCGACPQLGSSDPNDLSREIWTRKRDAYAGHAPVIVCPSQWLAREASQSALFGAFEVRVIPYGVPHTVFRPRDASGMRRALGIPEDHAVLLFVAQSTDNNRKGFRRLQQALSRMEQDEVTLVSIGGGHPDLGGNASHVHLGSIQSNVLLAACYSMADLFVIPSLQDNLPNTVLEAMACGTPVVGFDTGGIPDMVRPGETGWLAAEVGEAESLQHTIEAALTDTHRADMGRTCRTVVEQEYTLQRQAERYEALYAELLDAD